MPIINNPFNGKMNLDVANYRISNNDYIDALNITKDAQGEGQDRIVSNILGNEKIEYTLPAGTNKVIGFYSDKVRNRAYYFIYNSEGYHSILYYDLNDNTVYKILISKTDSNGVDILSFNPSYKVLSVNIFYRDEEGDLLFFNDGLNPPKYINTINIHGTSWKLEYLLIAKAPPIMPPQVVYENDTTVSINNLRNKLFQFGYRFVYENNEKSVWSSKSIVPLPQQDNLSLTQNPFTNNSRISVNVSTGGADVTGIELCFRETTNETTSDWFLIKSINKEENSIADDSIYTFNFKNDSVYAQIALTESSQLQDYVPQKANAAELANGNVLLYAGITEGYNKTNMNLEATSNGATTGFFFDTCGLLFFAECEGLNSGSTGSRLKIRVFGTGTNTDGVVTTLDNPAGTYTIHVADTTSLNEVGIAYTYNSATPLLVSTLLGNISAALIGSSANWSQYSLSGNVLTMDYNGEFILYSSGIILREPVDVPQNTTFSNAYNSGYEFAIQYFDSVGRTIGAQTSTKASFTTFARTTADFNVPFETNLYIYNTPPLEARYYQVLRSNNTTYNKILYWISTSARSGIYTLGDLTRYAYINIDNIQAYNEEISSTSNVVSYTFTPGDRIKFLRRFDVNNNPIDLPQLYDYEILGMVYDIQYTQDSGDPITVFGNFIKILYPTNDISTDFAFNNDVNFQNYEILLYNYTNNTADTQRFFYEFGKCYGIGNPGTATAYHIGQYQTQSPTDPTGVPAIIQCSNGDLFSRKRNVPYNDKYVLNFKGFTESVLYNSGFLQINPIEVDTTVENTLYKIQNEVQTTWTFNTSPTWASSGYLFYNKSNTQEIVLDFEVEFNVSSNVSGTGLGNAYYTLYSIVCTNKIPFAPRLVNLLSDKKNTLIPGDTTVAFKIKKKISIPPTGKLWIGSYGYTQESSVTFSISSANLNLTVDRRSTIDIIESSFSDNYNLVTNSNGRPSVIEENAKQVYFPTLIRFSQAYQTNTDINGLNNFYPENFDEYDRSFGDVVRLHVRDRYLKVYQTFKVGNVPILTQIIKDSANNPLQANTDQLINKVQYYAGDYGIGDAGTSLAWNNFADYFVDNFRGVVCRLSQDGITPISILNNVNAFFAAKLPAYRKTLNNGISSTGSTTNYNGDPCIYGVFDAYTNKYIIAMEEINRYSVDCQFNGGSAYLINPTTTTSTTTTTSSTTTISPSLSTTTTTTTEAPVLNYYNVTKYNCHPCSISTTGLIASSPVLLTNGYYYNNGDGFVYLVNFGTSMSTVDVDLQDAASSGTNCEGTCNI